MRILVIGGLAKSLVNFKGELLRSLRASGHAVYACANGAAPIIGKKLGSWDVTYYPIRLSRAGLNPIADLHTLVDLTKLMRKVKPDVVLAYTIKPIIYGSFAALICRISEIYSMIEGLGYAFIDSDSLHQRFTRFIVTGLYKLALRSNQRVFFLNPDDKQLFIDLKVVCQNQVVLINGTGVDMNYFKATPLPPKEKLCFLLIARLLRDKGIIEYVEAARLIKLKYPQVKFLLVGDMDENPACVTQSDLSGWIETGVIEYLGFLEDVRPALAESSVYVLPSYREGVPRTVLEAMAMGRPIITTDVPGCRETIKKNEDVLNILLQKRVVAGENGFLVPIKDAKALAYAMKQFIINPDLIERMGACSRHFAAEKFDVNKINAIIFNSMGLA